MLTEIRFSLTGKPIQGLLDELAGRIFLNPETSRWETADEYLSEDVAHKLRVVKKLRRPDLTGNLAALQAVQPLPTTQERSPMLKSRCPGGNCSFPDQESGRPLAHRGHKRTEVPGQRRPASSPMD
jgi:hypothetical protein